MRYADFQAPEVDNFSESSFGKVGQITVLGWVDKKFDSFGKHKKIYLCLCSECSQDPELFGDGVFISSKSNLVKGQIPCGCSKKPTWSKEQLEIRLQRKVDLTNYKFIGLVDSYRKATTKVLLECTIHGVWDSTQANAVMIGNFSCPSCTNIKRIEILAKHNKYEDQKFIDSFYNSGVFSTETIFTRSSKLDKKGREIYWEYTCQTCKVLCCSTASHIKKGRKSCECTKFNPKQAYIKIILDNNTPLALKYGVANLASNRLYRNCVWDVKHHSTWIFNNRSDCLKAERYCKDNLVSKVIPKNEMPDGYTETTSINNIEKIIDIYKSFGGTLMKDIL